ncbi:hypothetical protein, partial [Corallococcus exiguus]|uniref:hypothetical protein n=1 Tax=Corallococcus exiguus TaxID=83462 RepID=UPI001C1308A8
DGVVVMGDDDFLAISEELRAATDRDYGRPVPVGEPWEVRVPTSLVSLREDASLPHWDGALPPPEGV